MDPQALVEVEGAGSVGYEADILSRALLRRTQREGVAPSWVMILELLKEALHFEHRRDGRGQILAQVLAPAQVRILVQAVERESSV